jgi:hypothetical protein
VARWFELLTAFVDAHPVVLWIGGAALAWQALALLVVVAHVAWAPEAVPDTQAMSDAEVDAELLSRGQDLEDLEKRGRELLKRVRERAQGQWEMTALGMWRRVRH